jgi:hypothetical protein
MNGGSNTLPTYEKSYAPSCVPKIRVEVYIPKRHARPYRNVLTWLIDEFTKMRGGCSVHESVSGYYRLASKEMVDERISMVYSDFDMDWDQPAERAEVLDYCARLKQFLLNNLAEEEVLISAFPVSHVNQIASV